ncbi:DUF4342 domain-containing protein [Litorihabitans aurantiacus]|uniref:DUF4342 domain-containing protein n=1 Tax=Litorihabitans aurantiacus TaxID=1930061 RepID=A0AA37UKX8_9MICO|nr:DUF4342 domain-containing protein [Litorihabitans aurantiacus]GMA30064.1 hypothetical protein GCM10025875_00560 [Litorihabitans aurantiacus]GMA33563.1 hypothetical protein GCM10025875_35550 [Litorihabitans aurantiacus]
MTNEYGTSEPTSEQPAGTETGSTAGSEKTKADGRTWTEEFKVSGENLLAKVKQLIGEGNVRRIIIKNENRTLLEVPLNAGLAVTAAAAVFAPVLVAVGAIAALVTSVTVAVERGETRGEGKHAAEPEVPVTPVDPVNPEASDSNHGTSTIGYSI